MIAPAADAACLIDGRPGRFGEASVALDDPVVGTGLGLFETLAVDGGVALDVELHLARLSGGCSRLDVPWPGERALREEIAAVARGLPDGRGWLRAVLTGGGRRFVVGGALDAAPTPPATALLLPWRCERRGPLVGLKTTSYAGHAIGSRWAAARGADEGLWRNDRGHLTEGCRSNLFLIVRGAVHTAAPADGLLPGTVRSIALEVCRARGLSVHEGKLRVPRLERASEAFLTSSLRGVRPLIAVDGRPIGDGEPGPLTATLAAGVRERRGGGA